MRDAVTEPWTIARVLDWTRQNFATRDIPSPRLEAELLIAHALGLKRVELYTRYDQPLKDGELAAVRALIERRRKLEPMAYITGTREFYARSFGVDARVLIPRPETEEVVGAALEALPPLAEGASLAVLDVCVGSGAIAVTLACERKDLVVDATDLSADAISVAQANATKLGGADRVRVHRGSLYEPVGDARFALVISNPPYIASAEIATLMRDVRDFEPRLALDGGPEGVKVLEPLVRSAPRHLVDGGLLVVEIGADQGARAEALAEEAGLVDVEVRKDLAGRDRMLIAKRPFAPG
jgi:release factor glutamine methyltransferase